MHPVFAVRLSVLRSCVLTTLCRVHLLGEREERGEIGDGRGREREWGENGKGMEMREMGMHEKIVPKRNRFGI